MSNFNALFSGILTGSLNADRVPYTGPDRKPFHDNSSGDRQISTAIIYVYASTALLTNNIIINNAIRTRRKFILAARTCNSLIRSNHKLSLCTQNVDSFFKKKLIRPRWPRRVQLERFYCVYFRFPIIVLSRW